MMLLIFRLKRFFDLFKLDDAKINGQGSFSVAGELHLSYKGDGLGNFIF
jgi:hypothetical protein